MDRMVVGKYEVDRYCGRRIGLSIELSEVEPRPGELTIDLRPAESYLALSICGDSGQNHDEIEQTFAGDALVEELIGIWRRWHLNGMRPYTRKQQAFIDEAVRRGVLGERREYNDVVALVDEAVRSGELEAEYREAPEAVLEAARVILRSAEAKLESVGETARADVEAAKAELEKLEKYGVEYKPGALWLVEPLPEEVAKRVCEIVSEMWEEGDGDGELWIEIDGDRYEVDRVRHSSVGVWVESGTLCFVVFESEDAAGDAAEEYWRDMAETDPREFETIVGADVLISWALGRADGPGSDKSARNLNEWLETVVRLHPEEVHASYDGVQRDVTGVSDELVDEIGFEPVVAYRC